MNRTTARLKWPTFASGKVRKATTHYTTRKATSQLIQTIFTVRIMAHASRRPPKRPSLWENCREVVLVISLVNGINISSRLMTRMPTRMGVRRREAGTKFSGSRPGVLRGRGLQRNNRGRQRNRGVPRGRESSSSEWLTGWRRVLHCLSPE